MSASFCYRIATPRRRLVQLLKVLLLLGMLGPGTAVAQGTDEVSIDVIVAWSAPFSEETGTSAIPDASHETILANGEGSVVVANGAFSDPGKSRLAALDALGADTDALISIDAGTSGDPQYWLDLVVVEEEPYGAFTLAQAGTSGITITMFMGPVATFADGMGQAQQAVLVDGSPIFDGVEPAGLQTLLDAATPVDDTDDGSATEEAQDEAQPTPDDSGLAGDGMYMSPHHGFELTWTDEWLLDPFYEEPVTSDVNFDVDQVYLAVDSPQWVWFTLAALPTEGASFQEVMAEVTSQQVIAQTYGENAELVVSRLGIDADGDDVGAIIIRLTTPEGYEFLAHAEVRLSDDGNSVAVLILLMLVDDVESGLRSTDDLAFEGGPVITLFTHEEILIAAEDAESL